MTEVELRKQILSSFKFAGFTIRSGSYDALLARLQALPSKADRNKLLDNLIDHVQRMGLASPNIEAPHIEQALKEFGSHSLEESESVFSVIDAMAVPKFQFDFDKKKFVPDKSPCALLANANAKAEALQNRYNLLFHRTQRHEMFQKPASSGSGGGPPLDPQRESTPYFELKKCEELLSSTRIKEVVVLGLLTQLKDGKIHLEDPSGFVELNLKDAQMHTGVFCEGCYVLAQGKYKDKILHVSSLGFPPAEAAESSRAYFGAINSWGGKPKTLLKYSDKLARVEAQETDATLIFLADCWLDDPKVMAKLRVLFEGYDNQPPVAIVMMGPFMRDASKDYTALRGHFQELADMLGRCTFLKDHTELVLVPDLDDFGMSNVLPRPPLPEAIAGVLRKRLAKVTLASNPCRLQYCTQQIVVMRLNLVTKLCRNALKFPEGASIEEHVCRTLVSQAHLAPLHMIPLPVYWAYDHALHLYPLPDLVVLGDNTKGFSTEAQGCQVVNVGSFAKHQYSFKVYVPATRTMEDSAIPPEEDGGQ